MAAGQDLSSRLSSTFRSEIRSRPFGRGRQFVWGLAIALLVCATYLVWTYWGRASLASMGLAATLLALLLFQYPLFGVVLLCYVVTSNFSAIVPHSVSAILGVTLLAVVVRKLMARDMEWIATPFLKLAILFWVWMLLTTLWSGNYDYFTPQDLVRPILLVIVVSEVVKTPKHLCMTALAAGIGMIVTGILTIQSALSFFSTGLANELSSRVQYVEATRFFGNWPEPNQMALTMVPFVGLNLAVLRTRLPLLARVLAGLSAAFGAATVFLSLSRGGMIALFLLLTIIFVRGRFRWKIIVLALLVIIAVIAFIPVDVLGRLDTLADPMGDESLRSRIALLRGGFEMITDSFPLGVGIGNYRTYSTDYVYYQVHGIIAHITFIDVMAEGGIVALLLFCGLLTSLYLGLRAIRHSSAIEKADEYASVCIVAAFAAVVWAFTNLSATAFTPFWLIMALVSAYSAMYTRIINEEMWKNSALVT